MLPQLKKLNYVVACLLVGILLISTGCGETAKGKEDKDYAKKQEKVLDFLKKLNAPDEIIQMIKKLGDPSVSAEALEKFINELHDKKQKSDKRREEGPYEEQQNFEDKGEEPFYEENQSPQDRFVQQIQDVLGNNGPAIEELYNDVMRNQDPRQAMKAFLAKYSKQYPKLKNFESQIGEYFRD